MNEFQPSIEGCLSAEDREALDAVFIAHIRKENASLRAKVDEMTAALRSSVVAIDDWLHLYAGEFCDTFHVKESKARVYEYGTIGYIAQVQEKNRAALAINSQHSDGEAG